MNDAGENTCYYTGTALAFITPARTSPTAASRHARSGARGMV